METDSFALSSDTTTKRETGRKAQLGNIAAAKVRSGCIVYAGLWQEDGSMKASWTKFWKRTSRLAISPALASPTNSRFEIRVSTGL